MKNQEQVRFIRKGGRIIPIRSKKERRKHKVIGTVHGAIGVHSLAAAFAAPRNTPKARKGYGKLFDHMMINRFYGNEANYRQSIKANPKGQRVAKGIFTQLPFFLKKANYAIGALGVAGAASNFYKARKDDDTKRNAMVVGGTVLGSVGAALLLKGRYRRNYANKLAGEVYGVNPFKRRSKRKAAYDAYKRARSNVSYRWHRYRKNWDKFTRDVTRPKVYKLPGR